MRQQLGAAGWKKTTALRRFEFFKDGRERRVAGPLIQITGPQRDAVRLEDVKGIFDFTQASVGIGKRYRGEQPEAAGMILDSLRAIFVVFPHQHARSLAAVAHGVHHQALDGRQHGGGNPVFVHHLQRSRRRPGSQLEARGVHLLLHGLYITRRRHMMMHVNGARFGAGRCGHLGARDTERQ